MTSFWSLLKAHVKESPDKVAIVIKDTEITYEDLYNTVAFYQKEISTQCKGTHVYLRTTHSINYVVYFLAIMSAGKWVIPITKDMTDREYASIKIKIEGIEVNQRDKLVKIIHDHYDFEVQDENTYGLFHLTSGSTGRPKICIRTLNNLYFEGMSYKKTLAITPNDIILNTPPLTHSFALGASLFASLVSGSTLIIIDGLKPKMIIEELMKRSVSMVILVPFIARVLAKQKKSETIKTKLRIALSGAGEIDKQLDEEFGQKFQVTLLNNYGSTETGGLVCSTDDSPKFSLGKAMYGVDVKIKDINGGEVAKNEVGILWVRTKGMATRYTDGEKMSFDKDGFYCTNDLVSKDESENLFYHGRNDDLINIGGKKVQPTEIESVMKSFRQIEDCYVFSDKNNFNIEFITAVVKLRERITESELRIMCEDKLASYKVPKSIYFVNEIPRKYSGKFDKEEIKKMVFERN